MTGYDPLFLNHKTVLKASETLENLRKAAIVIVARTTTSAPPHQKRPKMPQEQTPKPYTLVTLGLGLRKFRTAGAFRKFRV